MSAATAKWFHLDHPLDNSSKNDLISEFIAYPALHEVCTLEPGNSLIKLIPFAPSRGNPLNDHEILGWLIIEGHTQEMMKLYLNVPKILQCHDLVNDRSESDVAELNLFTPLLKSLEEFSSRMKSISSSNTSSRIKHRKKNVCPNCQRLFFPRTVAQMCCTSGCQKTFEYISQMKRLREGRV
ncbi:MAG: hypothetical protein ACE5OZ_09890 [Candidatus Heimdallarchaeota archaeon]